MAVFLLCLQQFAIAIMFILSFFGLGRLILKKWIVSFSFFDDAFFLCGASGIAITILFLTVLSFMGGVYTPLIYLPVMIGLFGLIGVRCKPTQLLPLFFILAVLIPFGSVTLLPPIVYDEVSYHLPVTQSILMHHKLVFDPILCRYPLFPFNSEVLFILGLAINTISARLLSWICLFFISVGCFQEAKRHGGLMAGLLAFAMLISCQMIIFTGVICYADIVLTLFILAFLVAFSRFDEEKNNRWAYLSAALLGMAFGTKYTALFFVSLPVFYFLWKRQWKLLSTFMVIFSLFGSPWCIRNALLAGNPFWPFVPQLFGLGPIWTWHDYAIQYHDIAHDIAEEKMNTNIFMFPYKLSQRLVNINLWIWPGFVFYFFTPENRKKWILPTAAILFILLWLSLCAIDRYFMPIVPVISILSACAIAYWLNRFTINQPLKKIVFIVLILLYIASRYEHFPFHAIPISEGDKRAYITPLISEYALRDRFLTYPDKTYDLFGNTALFYGQGKLIGEWVGPASYEKVLNEGHNPAHFYQFLKQLKVGHILVNKDKWLSAGNPHPRYEQYPRYFTKVYEDNTLTLYRLAENPG